MTAPTSIGDGLKVNRDQGGDDIRGGFDAERCTVLSVLETVCGKADMEVSVGQGNVAIGETYILSTGRYRETLCKVDTTSDV